MRAVFPERFFMTTDPLIENLSDTQAQAVTHGEGPLVVFAGAGSGKTRVLTHRIAHLIQRLNVAPYQIMAVTFTNKAAAEMRERVETLLPGLEGSIWVSTFHSACVRILRRDAALIGYDPSFVIYDTGDQKTLLKEICKKLTIDDDRLAPRKIQYLLDDAKNRGVDPKTGAGNLPPFLREKYQTIVETYTKQLKKNNAFDFGDLISKAVELLDTQPEVREHYNRRLQHILVDEFQDTNPTQYKLLQLLLGDHNNVCVVGDDDQSIYRWRGAEVANILDFEKDYPGVKTVMLGENYRSTKTILEAASCLIAQNRSRKPKELFTKNPIGDLIKTFRADDEYDEARWVVEKIRSLADKNGVPLSEVAIFYRTNAQSRVFEDECARRGTPYQVLGGLRFYERKEIKDVLAYLRAVVNPADSVGVKRIINVPPRGIGKATIERIDEVTAANDKTFLEGAKIAADQELINSGAGKKVRAFLNIIEELKHDAQTNGPQELLQKALERSTYLEWLTADKSVEALTRKENIGELVEAMGEYEKEFPDGDIGQFLEQVALVSDPDMYDDTTETVSLMTVHSAKGLEFPAVFVVGLEEGLFPHSRSIDSTADLEEERRLCYVAITRARQRLFLSSAQKRSAFGRSPAFTIASRFFDAIPEPLMDSESVIKKPKFNPYGGSRPSTSYSSPSSRSYKPGQPADPNEPTVDYSDSQVEPGSGGVEVGMAVRHAKLGRGKVLFVEGEGEYATAIVQFERVGIKRLRLQFAKLAPA
jgi:ATP-dependent DNA helicase UvrD/PcrA